MDEPPETRGYPEIVFRASDRYPVDTGTSHVAAEEIDDEEIDNEVTGTEEIGGEELFCFISAPESSRVRNKPCGGDEIAAPHIEGEHRRGPRTHCVGHTTRVLHAIPR